MSSFFSSLYSFISSYGPVSEQPFQAASANLSSRDRDALVQDVATQMNHEEVESTLAELEVTLDECKKSLEEFERKLRFLGVRIDKYKSMMHQREGLMQNLMQQTTGDNTSTNEDDLENKKLDNMKEQLDSLRKKHETEQKMLQDVVDLRLEIVAQMELSRRRISDLEGKRDDIQKKREECSDFMAAAAEHGNLVSLEDLEQNS